MEKFKIELKWAVIFSICFLIWMYFEKTMGWHDEKVKFQPIYTMLFGIISILIYVLALQNKKKNYYNNKIDWKQGFLSGAILSLLVAIFTPVVLYITFEYISPDYFTNIINYKIKNSKMTLEDAEKYFSLSNYMYTNTFSTLSNGIVISAIISYFIKSKTN
ncbi:DUF4199 domain-containing protein [uncultured Flavobacterium sp.]|uniref:DUF4199 domain-containing protein n=1 Tax=uncultured Flavobacterium sp. TaxID=165435 RepID=UPI0030ED2CB1|tara:strand:+ start:43260 stop:43742 length:483 start_codon:yes stop_codon:yes gene_type:complete